MACGAEGRGARRGQGPPPMPLAIVKGESACADGARGEPGGEVDPGGVGAAGRGRRQGAALAFAEVDPEVGVGKLGKVVEARDEAAAGGVGVEPARDLDQDPRARATWRPGRRRAACRRGSGRASARKSEPSIGSPKSGLWTVKSPILESLGQPAPGAREDRLRRVLGRGADAEARPDRGVDRHPLGQRHDRPLHLRGSSAARGRAAGFAVDVEVEVEAARRGGAGVGRAAPRGTRVEAERVAAFELAGSPSLSWLTRRRDRAGLLPGARARRRSPAGRAGGGQGQVGARGNLRVGADRAFGPARSRARPRSGSCRAGRRGLTLQGTPQIVSARP